MRALKFCAAVVVALALGVTPAHAAGNAEAGGGGKTKAPGQYCKDQSKKKRDGQKKSDFALCVSAMAKLKGSADATPASACKALSKKKAAGEKKSAYAKCVSGGKQLLEDKEGGTTA